MASWAILQGCYVFCLEPVEPDSTAHARFFNPTVGIWEDPATGSAAGPLTCYLVKHDVVPEEVPVIIESRVRAGASRPPQCAGIGRSCPAFRTSGDCSQGRTLAIADL